MTYTHKITSIGTFHQNYCEDYALFREIGESRILMSVMDGCTMGTESYFASALIGKLLKKISQEEFYLEYGSKQVLPLDELLKKVIKKLFNQLKELKIFMQLGRNELLSTINLGIVDIKEKTGDFIVVGDGFIYMNDLYFELDQDNQPDYIGYHLKENFEDWWEDQDQFFSFENIEDITVSTDGIFTFSKYDNASYPEVENHEVIKYLLNDTSDIQNERMFEKKLHHIENKWGLKPTDDLGIVRLILP